MPAASRAAAGPAAACTALPGCWHAQQVAAVADSPRAFGSLVPIPVGRPLLPLALHAYSHAELCMLRPFLLACRHM